MRYTEIRKEEKGVEKGMGDSGGMANVAERTFQAPGAWSVSTVLQDDIRRCVASKAARDCRTLRSTAESVESASLSSLY